MLWRHTAQALRTRQHGVKSAAVMPKNSLSLMIMSESPAETGVALQARKKKDKKKEKKEKRQKKDKRHKKEYSDEEGQIHDGGWTTLHLPLSLTCPRMLEVISACV